MRGGKKMREKILAIPAKIKAGYIALSTGLMCMGAGITPVYAGEVDPDAMVGNLVGIVCSIFRYIGILLLVWGVGQLVLAFKNEDADSKSRAMMLIVASIILIALKSLIEALGLGITIGEGI